MRGKLLKEISRAEVKRGDIFVSGTPGGSNGSAGYTGIFLINRSAHSSTAVITGAKLICM